MTGNVLFARQEKNHLKKSDNKERSFILNVIA